MDDGARPAAPIRDARLRRGWGALETRFAEDRAAPALLYGLAWAIVLAVVVLGVRPSFLQSFNRENVLSQALRAFDHGQPLLVAERPDGSLYPVGLGDDLGMFVLGPLLGRITGIDDAQLIARLLFLAFFVPSVLVTPFLFRRITGSPLGALLAPAGVVGAAIAFAITPYWASAWAILGLLPVVLWLDTRCRAWAGPVLLGVAVLAGVASTLRAHAGAAVLLALVVTLATRSPWRVPRRVGLIAAAVAAYLLVSMTVVSALQDHRNQHADLAARYPDALQAHVFWHTAYIGLGYLPNRHKIWWNDAVGLQDARRRDPTVRYLTGRYERVLRDATIDLVEDDPGLVAATFAKKLVVAVAWAVLPLLVLLLTLPWALRVEPGRTRRMLIFTAPAAAIGLGPSILGLPIPEYLYGWLSALVLICLVTVTITAGRTAGLLADGRALREIVSRDAYPRHRVTLAAAIALLLALTGWGIAIKSQADDWAAENGGTTATPPAAR